MSGKRDKYGIRLKYPNRTCKRCGRYPCFEGIELMKCNAARYGCIYYSSLEDDSPSQTSSK